jgi:hypothetical protein
MALGLMHEGFVVGPGIRVSEEKARTKGKGGGHMEVWTCTVRLKKGPQAALNSMLQPRRSDI